MDDKELSQVFRLLSIIILADAKVYKEEVDAMSAQLIQLCRQVDPDVFITETMAQDWFQSNRKYIQSALKAPYRESYVKESLESLSDSPHKSKIYDVMMDISHSDGEFHKDERSVVILAEKAWNMGK